MNNRITGLIAAAVLATTVSACDGTANRNANTNNANGNANANLSTVASPTPTAAVNANRTPPTREEYARDRDRYDKEAREEARGAGRTVGTGLNDAWLWTKTRFELAAADDLRDSTINVDVDNAVVTLTGTVASAAQRSRAEQVAKGVEDVKSVRNQLRIASDNANGNANTRRGNANR